MRNDNAVCSIVHVMGSSRHHRSEDVAALRTQTAALVATFLEHHASFELLLDGCLGADRIALAGGGHAAWLGGIDAGLLTSEESKELILSSCSSFEALNLDRLGRHLRNLLSLGFLFLFADWLLSTFVLSLSFAISLGLGACCLLFNGLALLRLGLGLFLLIFLLLLAAVFLFSSLVSAVGRWLRSDGSRINSVFHGGGSVLAVRRNGIVVMLEVGRWLAVAILGNFLQAKSVTGAEPYVHWHGELGTLRAFATRLASLSASSACFNSCLASASSLLDSAKFWRRFFSTSKSCFSSSLSFFCFSFLPGMGFLASSEASLASFPSALLMALRSALRAFFRALRAAAKSHDEL